MAMTFASLPPDVARPLQAYARRQGLYRLLRAILYSALIYAVTLFVAMHIDRLLFLDTPTRVTMSWICYGIGGVSLLVALVWVALLRANPRKIAYEVEARLPEGVHEVIVTATQTATWDQGKLSDGQKRMLEELLTSATARGRDIKGGRLAKDRKLRVLMAVLVCMAIGALGLILWPRYEFALMAERLFFPHRNLPKPSFVKLEVKPGHVVVGKGGEVVVQVETSGEVPFLWAWLLEQTGGQMKRCEIAWGKGRGTDFSIDEQLEMSRAQRRLFVFTRADLQDSQGYRIRFGDAQTAVNHVDVIAQPVIRAVRVHVTPPVYALAEEQIFEDPQKPLRLLSGSKVSLSFSVDQPVVKQQMLEGKKQAPVELEWDAATRTGKYAFEMKSRKLFEILVENRQGFSNVDRVRLRFEVREDQPPSVAMQAPMGDREAVPSEWIGVRATVRDDLGLKEVMLRCRLNPDRDEDSAPRDTPITLPEGTKLTADIASHLDLEATGAVPGDVVGVRLRARDTAGNYGETDEIMIRVIPFTRGENERLRLKALAFLQDALAVAAKSLEATADKGAQFGDWGYPASDGEKIQELAKQHGVVIATPVDGLALLRFLEREHHFTDGPRDKDDIRQLYLVLMHALRRAEGGPAASLSVCEKEILPGLRGYRRLKNAMGQLYSLRDEAEGIREKLLEIAASEEPQKDAKSALKRRTALFQKTLGNVAGEVVEWSRTETGLSEKELKLFVGDLNMTARFMGRGPRSRRPPQAIATMQKILGLVDRLRVTLQTYWNRSAQARAKLAGAYDEALQRASKEPRDRALTWFDADARLLGRNPYSTLGSKLRTSAMQALRSGNTVSGDWKSPLRPAASLQGQLEAEEDLLAYLSMQWQRVRLLTDGRIGADERELFDRLLSLEYAEQLAGWTSDQTATALGAIAKKQAPAEVRVSMNKDMPTWQTAARSLATSGWNWLGTMDLTRMLSGLEAKAAEAVEARKALEKALREGKPEVWQPRVLAYAKQVGEHEASCRRTLRAFALRISCGASIGKSLTNDEANLLVLRTQFERQRLRMQQGAVQLTQAGQSKAGARTLGDVNSALRKAGGAVNAWHRIVVKRKEAIAAGKIVDPEWRDKFPLLANFANTTEWLKTARGLTSGVAKGPAVQKLLQDEEAFVRAYLTRCLPAANRAYEGLREARAVLSGTEPKMDTYKASVRSATVAIEELERDLDRVKTDPEAQALQEKVAKLREGAAGLSAGPTIDLAWIKRKLFDLGGILKKARSVQRGLGDRPDAERQANAFRGGPPDIWDDAHRFSTDRTLRRMWNQHDTGRTRMVEGMLEAFNAKPEQTNYLKGLAWAEFNHRLVRSDLYGTGSMRTSGGGGKTGGDPHLRFLLAELAKAKRAKQPDAYAEPSKEYLRALGDFLRY